jgi:hypothetical protein
LEEHTDRYLLFDLREAIVGDGKMKRKLTILWGLAVGMFLLVAAGIAQGRTITVGQGGGYDFNTIQAAIDDANDGDVVIVSAGTYTVDGNRDIDFKGKAITVRSADPNDPNIVATTIIDCNGTQENPHRGFYFHSGENLSSELNGVTICNGYVTQALGSLGGAIYCESGSGPKIINCRIINSMAFSWPLLGAGSGGGVAGCDGEIINCLISGNGAMYGGGLADCDGSIQKNIITNNKAGYLGGGLCSCDGVIQGNTVSHNRANSHGGGLAYCSASIRNNVIYGNSTYGVGGGLYKCNGEIENNTISGNEVYYWGAGLSNCSGVIANCIIWQNKARYTDSQIIDCSVPSYSCIQDWQGEGIGNITTDPLFTDATNGDYHLKSQAGRWDANEGRWTKDDVTSPCIDAGDPASPIGLEPFPNGGIINMGAYGGTEEASKSYFGEPVCETIVAGDINGDCEVNFEDFSFIAFHWLEEN